MKPDTFTELIRRKLESIRPDATERDWVRMQRSLQRAGLSGPSGAPTTGVGSMPSWLLAVAGIGTAVLLAVAVWQRSEINTLREQLTQQTTTSAPDGASATLSKPDQPVAPTPRTDTVYISRYVPVEPVERAHPNPANRLDESRSVSEMSADAPAPSTSDNQPVIARNTPRIPTKGTPDVAIGQALPGSTSPDNVLQTDTPSGNDGSENTSLTKAPFTDQSRLAGTKGLGRPQAPNGRTNTTTANQQPTAQPSTNQPTDPTTPATERILTETVSATEDAPVNQAATPETEVYTLATTRSLLTKHINWNARLARRFARPTVNTATVSQPESPASQPRTKLATTFRIGLGSDLRVNYWNTGALAETVLGGHWVIGVGLVRSNALLGSFVTDDEYAYRTRHDFRHEFAPNFDPKREIYGIDVRSIRYQIPVSLGYRIPVSKSLSLIPSMGAYLDLNSDIQVAFSYRTPPPRISYETAIFQGKESPNLLNAYTAGAALEWQQNHWVVQGGLLYAQPLYSDMNGAADPALGGRARLLYQF